MTKSESKSKHPLAEIFGFAATDMSTAANRHRTKRLCPFNNKVPNCTKDKAQENGKGILSRWYPQTIARRITDIELVSKRLEFIHNDAFDVLARFQKSQDAVFFIDPPYTAGGKRAGSRLYTHSKVDHDKLFSLCEKLHGDFLMTYDNAEEVRTLAERHGFETKSVSMKNTHHAEMTELLIGRNLDWVDDGGIFREEPQSYKVPLVMKKPRRPNR